MAGQKESVFEGKTLDDAVRMGLSALGLSRAEVMITVMEEGSGGFLGLGARPYKVRVMPRPGGPPREPVERAERSDRGRGGRGGRDRDRGRGRGDGRRSERGGDRDRGRNGPSVAPAAGPRREDRGPRDERAPREDRGVRREVAPDVAEPAVAREPREPRPGGEEGEGGRRRRRGRRGGRGGGGGGDRPMTANTSAVAMAPGEPVMDEAPMMSVEPRAPRAPRDYGDRPGREERGGRGERGERRDRGERGDGGDGGERGDRDDRDAGPAIPAAELEAMAVRATEQLLGAMGFEPRLSARADGSNVDVTAEVSLGEDLLTGRKGEVRQALQHLLNLTINRDKGTRYHLQLESNDFWQRREAELETMARSMADEAVASGGEIVTEYLNAQERRIIHVTLREDARVKTYAIGDGLIKKLAVAPADQPEVAREEG